VTDPREDRARIEGGKDKLLKDCYAWILDDNSFQRWRTQDESRLLWIKGEPGKGKTMMTMGVIDQLSRKDEVKQSTWNVMTGLLFGSKPCIVAYFFCQSTRPELNNAVSVLRGLVYLI
jgi:Cdc6-like AAA superfamily ATPase